ncbi:MAG: ECF-type sigma factor [Planctomycetota bacterium]
MPQSIKPADEEPAPAKAEEQLFATVHQELRALARRHMAREGAGHTLQATALVSEAYLRLRQHLSQLQRSPEQFYLAAADAMRTILIDHARRRSRHKRGGDLTKLPLDLSEVAANVDSDHIVAVHEAIAALAEVSTRSANVVRLRFFAGLTEVDVARLLGVSERTVRREWTFARAWLAHLLRDQGRP